MLRHLIQHGMAHSRLVRVELLCEREQADGYDVRFEIAYPGAAPRAKMKTWLRDAGARELPLSPDWDEQEVLLAFVKRLISGMGGELALEERSGETAFVCRLRLGVAAVATRPAGSPRPSLQGRSMLAVTPDRALRRVLEMRFATLGIRPVFVESGAEALRMLAGATPGAFDAGVIQYQMQAMHGPELARWLRAQPIFARLPLLAISMVGEVGQARSASEAGFQAYLTPPLPKELLEEALVASLQRGEEGFGGPLITRFTIEEERAADQEVIA
jgi:CheY-like chemotaxis protein